LRSLQEIQLDFVEEAKAKAGLWSQGKKKKKKNYTYERIVTGSHFTGAGLTLPEIVGVMYGGYL
jgi:hypothetical protein